jgi:hypothetical protein
MPAAGVYATGGPYLGVPCGYQQLTLAGAVSLTVPANAKYAVFVAETQAVRWRDDGTAPTTSVGVLLPTNLPFTYLGNLSAVKVIQATAGAILNVSYYY